jgi:N-carbamoylputrescine amidase
MSNNVLEEDVIVKVAVVQMEPVVGEKEDNVKASVDFILEAVSKGANLIVLPELCNSGYVFNSRKEAFSLSEPVPSGPTTQEWIRVAKENNVYISAGISENAGNKIYNSSVLVGPEGYIGTYRKMHLWDKEKLFFEPGDLGFPVFDTPIGKISQMICYDMWFPESWRLCALKGADIVCVNNNWVPIPGQDPNQKPMAVSLCVANAHSNVIFIAASNRIGIEREQPFIGNSIIVGPTGAILSGPASDDKEEIIYADLNLFEARTAKNWTSLSVPLRDRRVDVYDLMLGTGEKAYPF